MSIIKFTCPSCGASIDFGENGSTATCEYCGSVLHFQQEVERLQTDHQAEITALTDRIYDLISEKKFIQAQNVANEGLLKVPYSGRLHLCLLMCELNLDHPEKLGTCGKDYTNSVNFHNCIRYMTDEDKKDLLSLAEKNAATVVGGAPFVVPTSSVTATTAQMSDRQRFESDAKSNSPEAQKQRVQDILSKDKPLIEKMREIAYNPYSKVNIVDFIVANGSAIINMIEPDKLGDGYGNTFLEFVNSDNNFYFRALEENLPEAEKGLNTSSPQEDRDFVDKVHRALSLWEDLNDIESCFAIEGEEDVDLLVEFYHQVEAFIQSNADYLSEHGYSTAQVDNYVTKQIETYQDYYSENLSDDVLSQVLSRLGYECESKPRIATPSAIKNVTRSANTKKTGTPTKSNSKIKLGVYLGLCGLLILGIVLCLCFIWSSELYLYGGIFTIFVDLLLFGAIVYFNIKDRQEKFCPNCKQMYDYDTDIEYIESGRSTKNIKIDPNRDGKLVDGKLIINYRVDCTCHNCGKQRSYNKKVTGGESYTDGSIKLFNPREVMESHYRNKDIIGSSKLEHRLGIATAIVSVIIAVILLITVPISAANGSGTKLPQKYYGTYYGIYDYTLMTYTISENECEVIVSDGLDSQTVTYTYEYANAKAAQERFKRSDYEGCPAIFVMQNSDTAIILWITDTENKVLTINSIDLQITQTENSLSEYMNDPKDYYKTFKSENGDYISLSNNGIATYSIGSKTETLPYIYANEGWQKVAIGSAKCNEAIVLFNSNTKLYTWFEYVDSNTIKNGNTVFKASGTDNDDNTNPQKKIYDMSNVKFGDLTVTYDGQEHSITATNLPAGVTVTYEGNGKTEVGTYTVTAHFTGDSEHYEPIPDKTATLTITKATYNMSGVVFNDLTVTYDGQEHSITATNLPEGVTVTYEGNGKTEVGTHTVTAHFTGDSEHYEPIPDKTATLTISPLKLNGISFESKSFVYDGQPKSIYISGNLPDDITVTYTGNDKTEAGVYTVTAKFTAPAYYAAPDLTATLTITRATHKVTFKQAGQPDVVKEVLALAGLAQSDIPNPVAENGYNIVWESKDLSCITADITVNAIKTAITYSITYHLDGGENAEGNPTSYDIETATITLLSATKTDYFFEGWYSDEQFKTQVTTIQLGSYGDINLYAKWTYGAEGLKYSLSGDEYEVTGYNGKNTKVIIPKEYNGYPVTSISSSAFSYCTSLESITIPDSITEIGDYAFSGCTAEIIWGNNPKITKIGDDAFRGYKGTSITIPDSVTSIGSYAFRGCYSLASITIPDGVTSIGWGAFDNCTSLESVYWNATNCTSAGYYSYPIFYGCSALTTIIIGDNVQTIPFYAFSDCTSLTSITIPDSITEIGDYAFSGCTAEIIWGNNPKITKIGFEAFRGYKGTSITIPDSITEIDDCAFYNCTSLTSVTIGNSVTSIGDDAFYGCPSLTSVTIGNSVTSIGDDAFYGCYKLVEVCNYSSLNIKIGNSSYGYVAYYAKNVYTVDTESKHIITDEGYLFYEDNEEAYLLGYMGKETELMLPLQSPCGKSYSIYQYAFYYCKSLESITIPDSVTSIGDDAFYGCSSLTSVTIGNSVTSIGNYAFLNCTSLANVTIGNSVTSIGDTAFGGCSSLTSITIPDSVKSIGRSAFYYCTSLESVTIGNSVTSIGNYAFYNSARLKTVYYGGTAEQWSKISIDSSNTYLTYAKRYYYSEEEPQEAGDFWHYVNGEIVIWKKEG